MNIDYRILRMKSDPRYADKMRIEFFERCKPINEERLRFMGSFCPTTMFVLGKDGEIGSVSHSYTDKQQKLIAEANEMFDKMVDDISKDYILTP